MSNFCPFNENAVIVEGQFDILPKVQDAMDEYHKKMKKMQKKRVDWKKVNDYNFPHNRDFSNNNDISNEDSYYKPIKPTQSQRSNQTIQNRYYGNEMISERPQFDYEQHTNINNMNNSQMSDMNNSQMSNMNNSQMSNSYKTNIADRINQLNNNINNTNSQFDNYNNLNMPQMTHNKKNSYEKTNDNTFNNSLMTEQANNRYYQDINNNIATRSKGTPGQLPVEHAYDYLDSNPNKIIDTRLMGEPTRQDNRGYFR